MQINKNYEHEIDIRDLFFHLAYRWRSMLVAAVIGALLLGGFQFLKVTAIHREGKKTQDEKQYEIDLQQYHDSLENYRSNIETYNNLIRESNTYRANSMLMTIDSQNEWAAIRRYYIQVDQAVLDALPEGFTQDPADSIAAVYISTLKNDLDADEMNELLGTSRREYIDELVAIWADETANTFAVQTIGSSKENVVRAQDFFIRRIEGICYDRAAQVGKHTLLLVNEDVTCRTDPNLSKSQEELNRKLIEYQDALQENRKALNELEDEDEPTPPGTHVKLFAAIGFVLGALLLAIVYAIAYLCGSRLHLVADLSEPYSLPVYGDFERSRARRPGKGLDRLFESWEFAHAVRDPETVCGNIVALLKRNYASRRVVLTGTVDGGALKPLYEELDRRLAGAVQLEMQPDFLHRAEAVEAANGADAVIVVEKKHASRLNDIERMAELLAIGKSEVGGSIIL